ncbi:FAD-dependent oxidoreductase [Crocosphaera chwakensis]|uniref:Oxidoreductase n=1 Tax=Crocosphaera chwakensis CCY0110 TaxID=391612 RepID=A3IX30_9CHRO|nr:FAD-dependent oxidoreductase [Crocosphaera chwakensis]EAZ88972.1 oxidoreductase [Crocosphaera chwakensis CCY0110]
MSSLSTKPISYWIDSTSQINNSEFIENISVDVAIVGAGIVGLTAAHRLKKAGKTVAVIESKKVATGVSGHTTAKITSLHQLIYQDLIAELGQEKAKLYADSNQAALEYIANLVQTEQIDCDFSRQNSYTFAESVKQLEKIEAEVEAAQSLGLPASFVKTTSLPFPISGAIQFENQAQFHVRKYLLHLAKSIPGDGSYLFEETRVEDVKEEKTACRVETRRGKITAKDVIVATNIPILDQGLFFAKAYPKRSYLIGAPIEPENAPEGMFIGTGDKYRSIRTTPYNGRLLLLVGGEGHKTGEVTETNKRFVPLEEYARARFGVNSIDYRWSSQDMVSFDKLPYIGKLTPLHHHIYVATGLSLWGMTKGTLSGMLLSDMILEKENPWLNLYDSTRATPFVSKTSIKQNADVAIHWIGDRLKGRQDSLSEINPGDGKVVDVDGEQVAVYRDEKNTFHAVSAVCSHLGCVVNWNDAEKSWDCPCHGARFDCNGQVLHGPATKDLSNLQISEDQEGQVVSV